METWAYCEGCTRWFYVPGSVDEIRLDHACPACETVSRQVIQSEEATAQLPRGVRS